MSFHFSGVEGLACADCGAPVTLEQYRRKVARCDDCEVQSALAQLGGDSR